MNYKILWADKATAMDRGGLVFDNLLEAEEYTEKQNQQSPHTHCWVEPLVAPDEKLSATDREILKRVPHMSYAAEK